MSIWERHTGWCIIAINLAVFAVGFTLATLYPIPARFTFACACGMTVNILGMAWTAIRS